MKEITVKAYTFDELSDAAKENARKWFREMSDGDDFWTDSVYDESVEQGGYMGIKFKDRPLHTRDGNTIVTGVCIWWSGFWSQGDGACFEGTWRASDVKLDQVADGWGEDPATTEIKRIAAEFAKVAEKYPYASFTVKHSGRYSHKYCTKFYFDPGEDEPVSAELRAQYKREDDDPELAEGLQLDRYFGDFSEDDLKEAARDFMDWIYNQLEKAYEWQNADEQVDDNIRANEYLFTESGSRSTVL